MNNNNRDLTVQLVVELTDVYMQKENGIGETSADQCGSTDHQICGC
ncbi:hypothetical protein [Chryseobacterium sp. SIMBA_029]